MVVGYGSVVYGSVGGIWQRWWYMAAVVVYGSSDEWCGGGVRNCDRTRNSKGLDAKTNN